MATRIPINKEAVGGGGGAGTGGGGGGGAFEDRQKRIWEDMETDMDRRRREWEEEIEKMRKEFFMLRPEGEGRGGGGIEGARAGGGGGLGGGGPAAASMGFGERLGERMGAGAGGPRSRLLETSSSAGCDDSRGMVVKDDKGNPVFKALFDVHDYRPEEVSVKMDADKIIISARHAAQTGSGSTLSRQYSREVKIPSDLDPMTLQCTMGPDGILAVEAPIPAPSYVPLRGDAPGSVNAARTGSPGRSGSPRSSSTTTSSSSSYSSFPPSRASGGVSAGEPIIPPGPSSSSAIPTTLPTAATTNHHAPTTLPPPSYQPPPVVEPVLPLPAGFKPVSTSFLNSAAAPLLPPPSSSFGGPPPSSLHHHHPHHPQMPSSLHQTSSSGFRDTSSPLLSGMTTKGGPAASISSQFQPLSSNMNSQSFQQHHSPPPLMKSSSGGGGGGGRIGSPVVSSEAGKFKMEIDIEDFKPEELTVKTQDKRVVICGRREEKVGNRSSSRELSREYTIPDSVDPLTIKAFFTDGGKLIVEAPYLEGCGGNGASSISSSQTAQLAGR